MDGRFGERLFYAPHNRVLNLCTLWSNSLTWGEVAIGALHESLENSLQGLGSVCSAKPYAHAFRQSEASRTFALQQYNKSIGLLTKARGTLPTEVVLMSCLLFLCLENFQHNSLIAVEHLQSGLNILEDWRRERQNSSRRQSSDSDKIIEEYLAPVFARIDLQLDTFVENYSRRTRIVSQNIPLDDVVPSIPSEFANMREVRDCVELEFRYQLQLLGLDISPTSRRALTQDKLAKLWDRTRTIYNRIDAMVDAMRWEDVDILRSVAYLKILYYTDKIMLQTSPYHNEIMLDSHTEDFQQILFWCEEYVRHGTTNLSPIRFSFRLDLGIVHIYHGVATRCRDPLVRRQAIRQLRASRRREGIWDSYTAANVAERVVTIEEQGLGEVRTSNDVPESSRIQIVRLRYDVDDSGDVPSSRRHDGDGNNGASAWMCFEWIRYPYIEGATSKEEEWVPMNLRGSPPHAGLDSYPKPIFGTSVYRHSWNKSKGGPPPIYGVAQIKAMLAATGAATGP